MYVIRNKDAREGEEYNALSDEIKGDVEALVSSLALEEDHGAPPPAPLSHTHEGHAPPPPPAAEGEGPDHNRVRTVMEEIKMVLGDDIEEDRMYDAILAADFNIERAINFLLA